MRVAALDDFAVQFHDQTQNAVRRRVLRTEVDRVVLDFRVTIGRVGRIGDMIHLFEIVGHQALPSAFSSPGSTYCAPSQGDMKSKLRKSWASFTGS